MNLVKFVQLARTQRVTAAAHWWRAGPFKPDDPATHQSTDKPENKEPHENQEQDVHDVPLHTLNAQPAW